VHVHHRSHGWPAGYIVDAVDRLDPLLGIFILALTAFAPGSPCL
jgi:hypothetical protein